MPAQKIGSKKTYQGVLKMRKNAHGTFRNEGGSAFVIALIMLVVLTLIGLASTYTSIFEMKLSGNKRGSTDAFYSADSGVQVVVARIENFYLSPTKYVSDKYNPFTDNNNPNPTNATVTITHDGVEAGCPRGLGVSATSFDFSHYLVESTGQDQIELGVLKSSCSVAQKVVMLVPTAQGGM